MDVDGSGQAGVESALVRSVAVTGRRGETRRQPRRPPGQRHLVLVRPGDVGRPEVIAAAAAHRLYERVLGPVGTDPDETGDPLLVPHFRKPNGALANRDRLERRFAAVLAEAMGDELDGAVDRLGAHLADILSGVR